MNHQKPPHWWGPSLRQPVFNWNVEDKYTELKNFEVEVTNIFITKHCNINGTERVPIMKKWWEGKDCNSYRLWQCQNKKHERQQKTIQYG